MQQTMLPIMFATRLNQFIIPMRHGRRFLLTTETESDTGTENGKPNASRFLCALLYVRGRDRKKSLISPFPKNRRKYILRQMRKRRKKRRRIPLFQKFPEAERFPETARSF